MNKEELIKEVKKLEYHNASKRSWVDRELVLDSIKQLDEPQKPVVPQFVADWIEYCKRHNFTLLGCIDPVDDFGGPMAENFEGDVRKCIRWCRRANDKLARAWLDGYEIEKEKRYLVKMKGVAGYGRYLNKALSSEKYFFASENEVDGYRTKHTQKELENAGFGWVFNCPGVEVKEVKE